MTVSWLAQSNAAVPHDQSNVIRSAKSCCADFFGLGYQKAGEIFAGKFNLK